MKKLLKEKTEIIAWLGEQKVKKYNLVEDIQCGFIVDVEGDVIIFNKNLNIQFGKVSGHFRCYGNQITSLEGAPNTVGGNFYCNGNQLTSLEGGPTTVGGSFYCNGNQLISLKGSPTTVGEDFDCGFNQLISLEGSPASVGGTFYCYANQLTSLENAPTTVGGNFCCYDNKGLGEYQPITDFKIMKEKILSDNEKKVLSTSLDDLRLKGSVLKL